MPYHLEGFQMLNPCPNCGQYSAAIPGHSLCVTCERRCRTSGPYEADADYEQLHPLERYQVGTDAERRCVTAPEILYGLEVAIATALPALRSEADDGTRWHAARALEEMRREWGLQAAPEEKCGARSPSATVGGESCSLARGHAGHHYGRVGAGSDSWPQAPDSEAKK